MECNKIIFSIFLTLTCIFLIMFFVRKNIEPHAYMGAFPPKNYRNKSYTEKHHDVHTAWGDMGYYPNKRNEYDYGLTPQEAEEKSRVEAAANAARPPPPAAPARPAPAAAPPVADAPAPAAAPPVADAPAPDVGDAVKCNANDVGSGLNRAVYRVVEGDVLRHYPNPPIASSWDPDWRSTIKKIDCIGLTQGEKMPMKPNNP